MVGYKRSPRNDVLIRATHKPKATLIKLCYLTHPYFSPPKTPPLFR
jgi:hypothetical protein